MCVQVSALIRLVVHQSRSHSSPTKHTSRVLFLADAEPRFHAARSVFPVVVVVGAVDSILVSRPLSSTLMAHTYGAVAAANAGHAGIAIVLCLSFFLSFIERIVHPEIRSEQQVVVRETVSRVHCRRRASTTQHKKVLDFVAGPSLLENHHKCTPYHIYYKRCDNYIKHSA